MKQQAHSPKKEKTRSVTYRLPVKLVEEIENEAMNHNISHNVMARQILEKYGENIPMLPVEGIDRKSMIRTTVNKLEQYSVSVNKFIFNYFLEG